jgi:5-(carboxyamino)imidazole ribonucleotide synthase
VTLIHPGKTIGIIGGGQLGRMAALAAAPLGYKTFIYTDQKNSPASHVANKTIVANFDDKKALSKFAKSVDVVTFEFENIPHKSVKILEESVLVRPGWKVLHISQNRLREKDFINSIGIGTAPYKKVESAKELQKAFGEIGTKCILKTVEFGYDGKGQFVIDNDADLKKLWDEINIGTGILEGMVPFECEVSVVVARGEDGKAVPYVPVKNIHKNGILDVTIAPAPIAAKTAKRAEEIACKIANEIELVGILAVEMFVAKNGDVLVNEIAPRPHNSGHWTMDACITSQFEQFIRAVCGLPLGNPDYHSTAEMKNLIGDDIELWSKYINEPNTKLHLYGKKQARAGRKMGHVTKLVTGC